MKRFKRQDFGLAEKRKDVRILALDSSGLVASVAVVEEQNLIGEYTIHHKKTHSQTLLPMLDEVSGMIELDMKTIDAIAVAAGPGSFTGLRIGSATAKGLGMALDKPIVEVPTVEALAYNMAFSDKLICPIMDARRNQVYTGLYQWENNEFRIIEHQMAVGIEELLEKLGNYEQEVLFLGDGVPVFRSVITEKLGERVCFAPAHMMRQRAGAVGARALEYMKQGKFVSATEHKPEYLRLSQAERERQEKETLKQNVED